MNKLIAKILFCPEFTKSARFGKVQIVENFECAYDFLFIPSWTVRNKYIAISLAANLQVHRRSNSCNFSVEK